MKQLFEKLLLEEDGFEDTELEEPVDTETDIPQEPDEISTETVDDTNVGTDTTEEENATTSEISGDESGMETTTTLFKVSFTLGKHDNWSRIEANSKEEAEQLVRDYVVKKWPDRTFEVVSVEEFDDSEELEEQLNESMITDAQPIETGAAVGMATIISDLIKDEYEAIDGYNSAIATAEAEGFGDMISVLTEIQAEENLHIGQLQTLMNMVDPNAHLVDDGQQEGIEQLANPLGGNEIVEESLKENVEIGRPDYSVDMSDEEYEDFRNVLTQHYGSPEEFFKRLHSFSPDFEIHNVEYDDVPYDSITLSSSDISQGTGNVIIYTVMDRNTGKIYRYADF